MYGGPSSTSSTTVSPGLLDHPSSDQPNHAEYIQTTNSENYWPSDVATQLLEPDVLTSPLHHGDRTTRDSGLYQPMLWGHGTTSTGETNFDIEANYGTSLPNVQMAMTYEHPEASYDNDLPALSDGTRGPMQVPSYDPWTDVAHQYSASSPWSGQPSYGTAPPSDQPNH